MNGTVMVSGNSGGPKIGYTLQGADVLSAASLSWMVVTNSAFDSNGNFTNTDVNAPGHTSRFYRLSVP